MQASIYLKVPLWELLERSVWFLDKALVAMSAESQANKLKNKHNPHWEQT